MIVVLAQEAEHDLEAIGDHIARDNPERALSFVAEMREACLGPADFPERFPLVGRYPESRIRRRVHGSYLIFYRVETHRIEILHVLHRAQDYEAILFPR